MLDRDILVPALAEIIREEVAKATAPLQAEIADLKNQVAVAEPTITLADVMADTVREAARVAALAAIADLPTAEPGKDAEPVTPEQIAEAVRLHFEANPIRPPLDGEPGKDAEPITAEQIDEAVNRHLSAYPVRAGADGVGLAGALIDKDGQLVVTLTDGTMRTLGPVVGRDGLDAKGEPGRDGLDLTHFDTELSEDGRVLTLKLESEAVSVTHELQLGGMIYRGVWRDQAYVKGDVVTWDGGMWHCNAPTSEKPIDGSELWTLAVRRGRAGKDNGGLIDAQIDGEGQLVLTLSDGSRKPVGKVVGRPGRDLTQLGPDGSKW